MEQKDNFIIKREKTATEKEEEIYIEETSRKIQTKLDGEFMLEYLGNLEWKIRPTINEIKIDLLYIE